MSQLNESLPRNQSGEPAGLAAGPDLLCRRLFFLLFLSLFISSCCKRQHRLLSFQRSKSTAPLCESRPGRRQRPHDQGWAAWSKAAKKEVSGYREASSDAGGAVRMCEDGSCEIQPGHKVRDSLAKDTFHCEPVLQ